MGTRELNSPTQIETSFFLIWFLFLLSIPLLSGCESFQRVSSPRVVDQNIHQKFFRYDYNSVWRAIQTSVHYVLIQSDSQNGILETDWVPGLDGYLPPHLQNPPKNSSPINYSSSGHSTATELNSKPYEGTRYQIRISLSGGKIEGKEVTRVTIVKKIEKLHDFFSTPEEMESDGIEEMVLFYRIERELIIEEALAKIQAQANNQSSQTTQKSGDDTEGSEVPRAKKKNRTKNHSIPRPAPPR